MKRTSQGLIAAALVLRPDSRRRGRAIAKRWRSSTSRAPTTPTPTPGCRTDSHDKVYLIMDFNPLHEPGQGNQGLRACNGYRYESILARARA